MYPQARAELEVAVMEQIVPPVPVQPQVRRTPVAAAVVVIVRSAAVVLAVPALSL